MKNSESGAFHGLTFIDFCLYRLELLPIESRQSILYLLTEEIKKQDLKIITRKYEVITLLRKVLVKNNFIEIKRCSFKFSLAKFLLEWLNRTQETRILVKELDQ